MSGEHINNYRPYTTISTVYSTLEISLVVHIHAHIQNPSVHQ